jgi:hypothetical protein
MTKRRPFNSMAETIVDLLAQMAVEHYEPFQRKDVPRTTKGLRR